MSADYYAVLGLESDADLETIKTSYRLLVRENHPDIAADKPAANARMAQILEAWRVLSDPDRRARYDAERTRREARQTAEQRPAPAATPAPAHRPASVYSGRRSGTRSSSRSSNPKARMLEQVNRAAHLYFQEGRAGDAVALCQRVLKADSKNLEATILLGDIYTAQGKIDMALVMYDRALLLQPHNLLVRNKRQKLRPAPPSPSASPEPVTPRPEPEPSATPSSGSGGLFQRLKSKLKG